jgi:SAM-dependent methyltransferase
MLSCRDRRTVVWQVRRRSWLPVWPGLLGVEPGGALARATGLCHGVGVGEDLWDAYDRMGLGFQQHAAGSAYHAHYDRPAVLAALGHLTGRRVLDAACGPGPYLRELLQRGAEVTAFDASPVMVSLARQRTAGRVRIDQAVLGEPLPYPDGAFDLIVCALAIHYASDRAAAFAECRTPRPVAGPGRRAGLQVEKGSVAALTGLARPAPDSRGGGSACRRCGKGLNGRPPAWLMGGSEMANRKSAARAPQVVSPRNRTNVALPLSFSRFTTEEPAMRVGDLINLAGLVVSVIGFSVVIWQFTRAANAREQNQASHRAA